MKIKMKMKKCLAMALAAGLTAIPAASPAPLANAAATSAQAQQAYALDFDASAYTAESITLNGQAVNFRAYRNIVYVAHPQSVEYQSMNLFVPEAYFSGGSLHGYTAKSAPIFLPNSVGGYMPGEAGEPSANDRTTNGANAILVALSRGCVVAAPAIRGRTTVNDAGEYVGKAPALIVDYKAAVRYLRHNRDKLPAGDTEKIISNGTSAGGALSALLGATGNSPDYAPYLQAAGAADERDDILAAMAYCPITNLEHADMAYEWVFQGVNEYHQGVGMRMPPAMPGHAPAEASGEQNEPSALSGRPDNAPRETASATPMDAKSIAASAELKALFPAYVNVLRLSDDTGKPLALDKKGEGSFRSFVESYYIASAQDALDQGEDLSSLDWLSVENGRVTGMDCRRYAVYATRLKATPAFDKFDLSSGENDEFGTIDNAPRHFTAYAMQKSGDGGAMADETSIRLLNPMNYIGQPGIGTARHWRIRHGTLDRDTSLAIPAILAQTLKNTGHAVDFAAPWGKGHAGDYDLEELFDWIDAVCQGK